MSNIDLTDDFLWSLRLTASREADAMRHFIPAIPWNNGRLHPGLALALIERLIVVQDALQAVQAGEVPELLESLNQAKDRIKALEDS